MAPTILVPLDFGPDADRALPVGRSLADAIGGRLDVVVVTSPYQAEEDEREARWHGQAAGVAIDAVHLRHDDDVAAAIVSQAQAGEATLCLASHAYHPVVAALFSSVSADVAGRDARPLVLVGPECDVAAPAGGQLLACLGGRHDAAVPEVAGEWARALGAKVELLTVDDRAGAPAQAMASAAADLLEEEGVDATWDVVSGPTPADAILAAAERMGSGLVVLGTPAGVPHEHGLGRLARAVVRHSRRPVLLAPGPTV
jgi:nucleotide-binding universal stress UspA family protein